MFKFSLLRIPHIKLKMIVLKFKNLIMESNKDFLPLENTNNCFICVCVLMRKGNNQK